MEHLLFQSKDFGVRHRLRGIVHWLVEVETSLTHSLTTQPQTTIDRYDALTNEKHFRDYVAGLK